MFHIKVSISNCIELHFVKSSKQLPVDTTKDPWCNSFYTRFSCLKKNCETHYRDEEVQINYKVLNFFYFRFHLYLFCNLSISLNISQYLSIYLNISQYPSISINISQYLSIFFIISQYISISLNISQ